MKTSKKSFIFAMLLGVLVTGLPSASKAAIEGKGEKKQGTIIANESEEKFASYIISNLPEFTKQENWSIIEQIVTLYNQQPSKIRLVTAETETRFENAVAELGTKLKAMDSAESMQWKSDLEKTVGAVRFIRNFDINSITNDQAELPALKAPHSAISL
jgi:hypothetical protein